MRARATYASLVLQQHRHLLAAECIAVLHWPMRGRWHHLREFLLVELMSERAVLFPLGHLRKPKRERYREHLFVWKRVFIRKMLARWGVLPNGLPWAMPDLQQHLGNL